MLRIAAKNIVVSFYVIISIAQSGGKGWPDFPVAVQCLVGLLGLESIQSGSKGDRLAQLGYRLATKSR